MNKLIHGIIAAVFGITCLWLSWMLTLTLDFVGETAAQLPGLTRFCLSLRPLLWVLPVLALGYCVYVWFSKNDTRKSWVGFFAVTMMVLVFVLVPTIIAAWLPLPHLVMSLVVRSHHPLDGKSVVLEGRWNAYAKDAGQIICATEPKVVDVIDVGDLATPKNEQFVRVTAVLYWRGTDPLERRDLAAKAVMQAPPQSSPDGYIIRWPEVQWETRR